MSERKTLRAGVIGIGTIGGGVATSLKRSGCPAAAVYDKFLAQYEKHDGCENRAESGAEVAEKCDIIMTALLDANQTREILTGENGVLSRVHEGMVIVCLSTIEVEAAKEFSAICADKGVGFLDVGVTPGHLAAENGLVCLVGGDEATFHYAKPVIDKWCAGAVLIGPTGSGMAAKIARNMITYGCWAVISDAVKLAGTYGIDLKALRQVLDLCDKRDPIFYRIIDMRAADNMPGLKLSEKRAKELIKYVRKDLSASIALSEALGLSLPVRDYVYENSNQIFDIT